jgi:DNA-damage-inducible protein J
MFYSDTYSVAKRFVYVTLWIVPDNKRGNPMSIATFSVRVDSELKSEADKCLAAMGMTMSTAINVYLHQIVRHQAIPFVIAASPMPNRETLQAIEEGERLAQDPNAPGYHDMESLLNALNA